MKAITAVCATGASVPGVATGRVGRPRDGENAEIQMYLSKLKDLVPFMPRNRRISKLEVIQNVIDYICDLQSALESHPAVNAFDPASALSGSSPQQNTSPRQPLGVRSSPNTILSSPSSPSSDTLHTTSEKSSQNSSDRGVSC